MLNIEQERLLNTYNPYVEIPKEYPPTAKYIKCTDSRVSISTPANLDTCIEVVRHLDLKVFGNATNQTLGWVGQEVEKRFPLSVEKKCAYGLYDAKVINPEQLHANTYGALKRAIQIIDNLVARMDEMERKLM